MKNISGSLETLLKSLLPHLIPLPTNPNRIFPQLRAKGFFDHQYCGKRINVYLVKEPLKSPSHPLPCHPKGLVNLLTICPLQYHITRPTRLQLHPQVFRFYQGLQALQKRLVLFG